MHKKTRKKERLRGENSFHLVHVLKEMQYKQIRNKSQFLLDHLKVELQKIEASHLKTDI
jgi:hypothetical protein